MSFKGKWRALLIPLAVVATLFGGHFVTQSAFAQHQFGQNPKSFGIMGQIQGLGIQATPTWPLQVDPTVTAITGTANAISATPVLKASANSDTLNGLTIAPTFTDGSFSGVTHYAINATGVVKATTFSGSGASLTNLPSSAVAWATPGTIGSTTPNSGAFTTLAASTGYNGAVGGVTPAAGAFTTLAASTGYNGAVGGVTPAAGAFTTLTASTGYNGPVGGVTPAAVAATTLTTSGTARIGTAGVAVTAMGGCTIGSNTLSTTATNLTCTGVPASAAVSVRCTGQAAFSTPTGQALYCRATGTVDQVACNTVVANTQAMAYSCSWVQP